MDNDKKLKKLANIKHKHIEEVINHLKVSQDKYTKLRIDLEANEKQINHLSDRLTRVEESSKQVHKRIDHISPEKG